jgi:hypothetical protein
VIKPDADRLVQPLGPHPSRKASLQPARRPPSGTGLTLAVLPHRWDERTFLQARGTTELDPKQSFRLGSALKAPSALNPVKGHVCRH